MIDWLRGGMQHSNPTELQKKLNFTRPVNTRTGEIQGTHEVAVLSIHNHKGAEMTVRLYPSGRLLVEGSLHKFWHGVNHTDFNHLDVRDAINYLCDTLEVKAEECQILQMEYGLNIKTLFAPMEFINRLICLKFNPFNLMKPIGCGRECFFTDWGGKFYDKGKQYNLPYHVLRIEKKVRKARHLQKMGIFSLADLSKTNLTRLGDDIIQLIGLLLVNDKSINEEQLSDRMRLALAKYRNPEFWGNADKYQCRDTSKRFKELIETFGTENYLNEVKELALEQVKQIVKKSKTTNKPTIIKSVPNPLDNHLCKDNKPKLSSLSNTRSPPPMQTDFKRSTVPVLSELSICFKIRSQPLLQSSDKSLQR